jgi:hypothetical protein
LTAALFSILFVYLHLEDGISCWERRLAWCNDPESYAGGSLATGGATFARQVKGEHPGKERFTGPPGWGLGRWASTSSPDKKKHMLKNLDKASEKRTVYLITDIKLEKVNKLRHMEVQVFRSYF